MENDSEIWEMAKIFGKWHRYMGHGLSIRESALLCWKWLKNLTNRLNMWEMTIYMLEMSEVFEKRLKYVRNDLDLWEMVQLCGEMT